MSVDLVIRNGTVLDGTGAKPRVADVGVEDDRITMIGDLKKLKGKHDIDAAGLYVTPGFIDIHSHSDYTLLVDPRAVSAIAQGVTLEVIGNCGFGCAPIANPETAAANIYGFDNQIKLTWNRVGEYLDRLAAAKPAVNVMTLVPNGQLRRSVLGVADRPATPPELKKMKALLAEGLDDGAFGYSTGLEYPAERGAPDEELVELCKVAAKAGGMYAAHTRRRDDGAVSAIDEAIRVGEKAGARIQISHLLPRKTSNGEDEQSLELIDRARGRGLDIAFDMHTRLYGTTFLNTIIPPWASDGGPGALARNLASADSRRRMREFTSIVAGGGWDRVVLLDHPKFPQYSRRSFGDLARQERRDAFDIALDILSAELDELTRAMVIIHAYTPDQQALIFSHPLCMAGSDATTLAPDGPLANSVFHGAYSWASWYFHFMVHERKLLSPAEAVQRLTAFPAKTLGLGDRGRIVEGYCADVAVFDPADFRATATTFEPNQLAKGMRHVVVNGVPTLKDGSLTGGRGGKVFRRKQTS
ncbi:MAG: amidohydrolase family protein [Casimicrobiaceae bacterium]